MVIDGVSIDMSSAHTIIYHMPDGKQFAIAMGDLEDFLDLGPGKICDTSDIDGIIHFFPRGNA